MLLQTQDQDSDTFSLTFATSQGDVPKTIKALEELPDYIKIQDLHVDANIVKISII